MIRIINYKNEFKSYQSEYMFNMQRIIRVETAPIIQYHQIKHSVHFCLEYFQVRITLNGESI